MKKCATCFVALAVGFGASGVPAASANAAHGLSSGAVEVVIDGLNNPRQIAVHGGAVYVAEAGTGGSTCFDVAPRVNVCAGFTGSVSRYKHGSTDKVQTGLLSIAAPEGDIVGVDALAFHGNQLFGIATGGCTAPGFAIPSSIATQAGKVLRLDGGSAATPVGDPGAFECANDPDHQGPDTDPYGLAERGGRFYVADAAGNDIVQLARGTTSLVKVLSTASQPQPVPTSLAWGPDGALYIGELNFEAGPGGTAVYRLDPSSGSLTRYADGLTAVTSLTFGDDGRLYVTEWTKGFDENGPSPDGDVVSIPPGGGTAGRQVLGAGSLHFPTGVGIQGDSLYVSNWGIAAGSGPGPHGQLVRIPLSGH